MANLELLSTAYHVKTIKFLWFLVKWHKHISADDGNIIWLEPKKGKWLAKLLYGTDKLDQEYFWKFGIDLKGSI